MPSGIFWHEIGAAYQYFECKNVICLRHQDQNAHSSFNRFESFVSERKQDCRKMTSRSSLVIPFGGCGTCAGAVEAATSAMSSSGSVPLLCDGVEQGHLDAKEIGR